MKKLLFVFRDMGTGGAQKIEAFVANTMVEAGYEVVVINMASSPCTVDLNEKIKIVDVLYDHIAECKNKLLNLIYKTLYLYKLRKKILEIKPDLICGFLSDVVRIIVLAMDGCNIPIIGSERGDPNVFTAKQFNNYKIAYEKCRGVVFQLDNVKDIYSLPSEIIQKVIPNPCIPRTGDVFCGNECSKHVVVGAGRLSSQKRFDLLIDAFEIIHKNHPEYKLHIYGDGPLYNEILSQIELSPARDAISLIGDVKDVFNENLEVEFFVLSSDFEGIPNVLIEAMAAKIPCVATDCSPGGAEFLLKNGKCGLLVPRDDKYKLAEAMEKYICDEKLREEMKEKGWVTIQEFNPINIKKMWLEVFQQCL